MLWSPLIRWLKPIASNKWVRSVNLIDRSLLPERIVDNSLSYFPIRPLAHYTAVWNKKMLYENTLQYLFISFNLIFSKLCLPWLLGCWHMPAGRDMVGLRRLDSNFYKNNRPGRNGYLKLTKTTYKSYYRSSRFFDNLSRK